ncbi:hypothetical protein ACQ4WX_35290 [Streptomyces lasalocidi]
MSNATTDNTRTLHAVPDLEPLAGLTGAPATIYAELIKLTGDNVATAAELSLAAGLGRSTTGKALVTLEEQGLAIRTPGGHDGPRRTPDRWRVAPIGEDTISDTESDQDSVNTEPAEPAAAITPEPSEDGVDNEDAPADEAVTPAVPDDDQADASITASDASPQALPLEATQSEDGGSGDAPHAADGNGEPTAEEPPARCSGQPQAADGGTGGSVLLPGGKQRLAPGALRQMVIDHLSAHPGEAFTATGISRVIEKSSGAIANALVKLVIENIAEQVSDRPRTYRMATPDGNV